MDNALKNKDSEEIEHPAVVKNEFDDRINKILEDNSLSPFE